MGALNENSPPTFDAAEVASRLLDREIVRSLISEVYPVCSVLHDPDGLQILGPAVVGNALRDMLAMHPALPVLFAGHGSIEACIGNDGTSVLSTADVHLLAGRSSFAIACYTGSELGLRASEAGGIWCGFAGPIGCLQSDDDFIDHFKAISTFLSNNIQAIMDANTADNFICDFESLIENIENAIIATDTLSMEPLIVLQWLRMRLRIWIPGHPLPRKSTSATEPASLF
jgi:hypothetical protein